MNKEETVIFDRKMLVKLIVPMVIEQLLSVTVGMADMIMVSGAGEEAVSGISLVNSINVLLIMVLAADSADALRKNSLNRRRCNSLRKRLLKRLLFF